MSDCFGEEFSSRKLFFHVYYSPQRPSWGQKKVALVKRWPLWEGRGVIWQIFFWEYNILIVLSSCLLYPIMVIHSLFIIEIKCINNVNNFWGVQLYSYRCCRQSEYNLTAAVCSMQRVIQIKFYDHSWPFHQSLKKLAVVERLFGQLGTCFSGHCCCREVAITERFNP